MPVPDTPAVLLRLSRKDTLWGRIGSPTRSTQWAAQAGNDLVTELRLCATIADRRKRFALFRELLNRLFYLVEIWMRFNGHNFTQISAGVTEATCQENQRPREYYLRQSRSHQLQ